MFSTISDTKIANRAQNLKKKGTKDRMTYFNISVAIKHRWDNQLIVV